MRTRVTLVKAAAYTPAQLDGAVGEAVRDLTFKLPEKLADITFSLRRSIQSTLKNLWIRQVAERTHFYAGR